MFKNKIKSSQIQAIFPEYKINMKRKNEQRTHSKAPQKYIPNVY